VQAIFLAAADYHDPEDRGAILDRECSADVELCPHFTALRVALYQINDSVKQPRVGSDDRDKPWLAYRSLAHPFLRNLTARVPRSVRVSYV
jgi:hypothetical protein